MGMGPPVAGPVGVTTAHSGTPSVPSFSAPLHYLLSDTYYEPCPGGRAPRKESFRLWHTQAIP